MAGTNPTQKAKAERFERFSHALWAGAAALILSLLALFEPLDTVVWAVQDRMAPESASGEIVLITSAQDFADSNFPERRSELAAFIRQLDAAGVERVYVDQVFDRATNPVNDRELNSALREFSGESYLVSKMGRSANGSSRLERSVPAITENVEEVGSSLFVWYAGYVWDTSYYVEQGELRLPNLGMHLAGIDDPSAERFYIDYSFDSETITALALESPAANEIPLSNLQGKTVVISSTPTSAEEILSVPSLTNIQGSLIHIYAAETLKVGHGAAVPVRSTLSAFVIFLVIFSVLRPTRLRRLGYAALPLTLCVAVVLTAETGMRMWFTDYVLALIIFGGLRARASWKSSFALVDQETGLPTFAALERDEKATEAVPTIIVAKIHRFDQVRRTLPKEMHSEYVLRIIARLKAATQDATIYRGEGYMIAWTIDEKDPGLLQEHLEGLRALFASPLIVGDSQVDVGITFGVDVTPSPNVARRLAAAVAAAEHTNETYDPIAIADSTSEEDLIWNISLQARIDAALSSGEIYLVYQPKILVQTGELIGVEALVRWKDPVKGHIPPDSFIRQCETAGRMSHLTRFVLEQACKAGNAFAAKGLNIAIAVNISATLVHERAVAQMVADVLRQTRFPPHMLTLEITETYRISSIASAAQVLGEMHRLGVKISMDDFGVGAASLEALLQLPFDELKIDRIFIARMASDDKACGIVRNILALGEDLRISVVAEGVEDPGTLNILRDLDCRIAQGFGISRPLEYSRILEFQSDARSETVTNVV